jgi:hypothetical protein
MDDTTTSQSPSRMVQLRAKLEQAKVARDAAVSAISDEERAEIEMRRQLAEVDDERDQAELEKRELDLDQRYEAACEAYPDDKITSVLIEEYPDSFVIRHSPRAFAQWEAQITQVTRGRKKKLDKPKISRDYTVASVIDWNGEDLSDPLTSRGGALVAYLTKNPGIVTSILNAAAGLAGAHSEARKS